MKKELLTFYGFNALFVIAVAIGLMQGYQPSLLASIIFGFLVSLSFCLLQVGFFPSKAITLLVSLGAGIALVFLNAFVKGEFLDPLFLIIGSMLGGLSACCFPTDSK